MLVLKKKFDVILHLFNTLKDEDNKIFEKRPS